MSEESKVGRPTDYKEEYCLQVEKLCKLGATDIEIAEFFEVCEKTVNNWKHEHPEFLQSIKAGKIIADMAVADSLYSGTQDRVVIEQQAFKIKVGEGKEDVKVVSVQKVIPADFRNQQFWLRNRRGNSWQEKAETVDLNKLLELFRLGREGALQSVGGGIA